MHNINTLTCWIRISIHHSQIHLVCIYNGFKHQGFLKCLLYQSTHVWFGITYNNLIIFTLELHASSQPYNMPSPARVCETLRELTVCRDLTSRRSAVSWSLWRDQMLLLYMIAVSAFLPPTQKAHIYVDVSAFIYVCPYICTHAESMSSISTMWVNKWWLPSWNII